MQHAPRITFVADSVNLLKTKEIVSEFVSFLKRNGYDFYYPFEENFSTKDIQKQIAQDAKKYDLQKYLTKIQLSWESFVKENNIAAEVYPFNQDFTCILTTYGPRGFFYTPDKIYVNIIYDSEREWLQTILHELLHLVHYEDIVELLHVERERFIDEKFVELWGDIFPEYSLQKISANR